MMSTRDRILTYFKFDMETLLNEFNNYYNIKYKDMPLYLQTFFLYFSNLSEIGLQILIKSNYPIREAKHLHLILPCFERVYTREELLKNMQELQLHPVHYYGLFIFSYFFYERFLDFIKFGYEKPLDGIITQIPTIESNILTLLDIIKSPPTRGHFSTV